jgi:vacuolar-type H+-ATPase subunit I/STV1
MPSKDYLKMAALSVVTVVLMFILGAVAIVAYQLGITYGMFVLTILFAVGVSAPLVMKKLDSYLDLVMRRP